MNLAETWYVGALWINRDREIVKIHFRWNPGWRTVPKSSIFKSL